MANFHITLIRPAGYRHTEAFREIAETLQFGLHSIGHRAEIRENAIDSSATNIILGAHLLSTRDMGQFPERTIIYNLEQLGGARLAPSFYELACRYPIWDYDLGNLEKWKSLQCKYSPVHVPIGYVPELRRISAKQPQEIDVLFYGSLNERRNRILDQLRDSGIRVHKVFGVYGEERDSLIARSKLVLNIHYYETKIFEIARISYLLANGKAVVTEGLPNTAAEHGLEGGLLVVPYESLVDSCHRLLQHDEERRALESLGFELFSHRKESAILSNALEATTVMPANPAPAIVPRKLNLGSGKDWRQDHFNIDVDSYWQPDAVLDFNLPLPIGEGLSTQRFGTITLQNNYFDEIISNDVLEHIRNLTTAMTTCLNLLRVGGLFKIAVPYDLSWGAWQDPTHVRAFNERSWLYYTDWFWYMGWTEARFDIAAFDLTLSPIGEALRQQNMKGEDLARHPRAVDHMRVALRKRLLTDAEKQQVQGYLKRPNRNADQLAIAQAQGQDATSGLVTSV
jgi:SAM-dependent methyltransferase